MVAVNASTVARALGRSARRLQYRDMAASGLVRVRETCVHQSSSQLLIVLLAHSFTIPSSWLFSISLSFAVDLRAALSPLSPATVRALTTHFIPIAMRFPVGGCTINSSAYKCLQKKSHAGFEPRISTVKRVRGQPLRPTARPP